MGKRHVRELEAVFDYVQGAIRGYRSGLNEGFIPHGLAYANEKLEGAKADLEEWGLYDKCQKAFRRVEELVNLGPEYDEEAEQVLLEVAREVTKRNRQ